MDREAYYYLETSNENYGSSGIITFFWEATRGFFILQDVNPIFQPTIVLEETTGPNCFKFGMELPFDILF